METLLILLALIAVGTSLTGVAAATLIYLQFKYLEQLDDIGDED